MRIDPSMQQLDDMIQDDVNDSDNSRISGLSDHDGDDGPGCAWCEDTGYYGHDCGEDSCACLDPEENVPCKFCQPGGFCDDHPVH